MVSNLTFFFNTIYYEAFACYVAEKLTLKYYICKLKVSMWELQLEDHYYFFFLLEMENLKTEENLLN